MTANAPSAGRHHEPTHPVCWDEISWLTGIAFLFPRRALSDVNNSNYAFVTAPSCRPARANVALVTVVVVGQHQVRGLVLDPPVVHLHHCFRILENLTPLFRIARDNDLLPEGRPP